MRGGEARYCCRRGKFIFRLIFLMAWPEKTEPSQQIFGLRAFGFISLLKVAAWPLRPPRSTPETDPLLSSAPHPTAPPSPTPT